MKMPIRLEIATKILAAFMSKSVVLVGAEHVRGCLDIANLLVDLHASDEKKRREELPPPPPPPPPAPGKDY